MNPAIEAKHEKDLEYEKRELHAMTSDYLTAKANYRKNPTRFNAQALRALQMEYDRHMNNIRTIKERMSTGKLI